MAINERLKILAQLIVVFALTGLSTTKTASAQSARDIAYRLHQRITGVPPSAEVLQSMESDISSGKIKKAAMAAMENSNFVNLTLKNFFATWTNEEQNMVTPLNDMSATLIGLVRDDRPFDLALYGDVYYEGPDLSPGLRNGSDDTRNDWSILNNDHYELLESLDLSDPEVLRARTQSEKVPFRNGSVQANESTVSGVLTTRGFGSVFYNAGTNRAAWRFTIMNFMCKDMENLFDTTVPGYKIRRDVDRAPGGDSRTFQNKCIGCHAIQDPVTNAFNYWDYDDENDFVSYYSNGDDDNGDPNAVLGVASVNNMRDKNTGQLEGRRTPDDAITAKIAGTNAREFPYAPCVYPRANGNRNNHDDNGVATKINDCNRIADYSGYRPTDDSWENSMTAGHNASLKWRTPRSGGSYTGGNGVQSLAKALAATGQFSSCMAERSFEKLCLRKPEKAERVRLDEAASAFEQNGRYSMKSLFADVSSICLD